ncbi:MAG: hypothetical protein BWZ02_03369 [Lentisphaerae bacterium ADurb.BinA184]|nr:MAG: hypothetical protein BWZ02_03369 [Lentisphaerae bacterium ADurb.BinA184]
MHAPVAAEGEVGDQPGHHVVNRAEHRQQVVEGEDIEEGRVAQRRVDAAEAGAVPGSAAAGGAQPVVTRGEPGGVGPIARDVVGDVVAQGLGEDALAGAAVGPGEGLGEGNARHDVGRGPAAEVVVADAVVPVVGQPHREGRAVHQGHAVVAQFAGDAQLGIVGRSRGHQLVADGGEPPDAGVHLRLEPPFALGHRRRQEGLGQGRREQPPDLLLTFADRHRLAFASCRGWHRLLAGSVHHHRRGRGYPSGPAPGGTDSSVSRGDVNAMAHGVSPPRRTLPPPGGLGVLSRQALANQMVPNRLQPVAGA